MIKSKTERFFTPGMDQRAFSAPEFASMITNFFFDDKLSCWDNALGFEPVEPQYDGKEYKRGWDNPVISGYPFYTNSGRLEYLLQEKVVYDGSNESLCIIYTFPDGEQVILDNNRTQPGIDDAGTQYLTYGRFCIVTNGRDRAFKFFGGSRKTSFGFTSRPATPALIGPAPDLTIPNSGAALDISPNGATTWQGGGIPLIPNIDVKPEIYDPANISYQLPSGYTLTGSLGSKTLYTKYSYWGLGITDPLEQNTYSYCVTFVSDTGAESPPSTPTSVSWLIPEKHLGGTGEANESNPYIAESKYGCVLKNIPIGGDNVVARKIYRTKNKRDGFVGASDEFFLVTTLRDNYTEQYIDFVPDNELVTPLPSITETDLIAPSYKYIAAWDGRIWLAGGAGTDQRVIYSEAGKPEQFGGFSFFDVGVRSGGQISGLYPWGGNLLVFREASIDIITKSDLRYNIGTLHPSVGTTATNTITGVSGLGVMFLASDGVYLVSLEGDVKVQRISDPVSQTVERMTPGALAKATAVYSPVWNEYWCHFPGDRSRIPNIGVVFHTQTKGWSCRFQPQTREAEFTDRKAWNINRLFIDKDGDVIICPETFAIADQAQNNPTKYYNVGLQVLSKVQGFGFWLSGATANEGITTFSDSGLTAAGSEWLSGWLNYQTKGQTFSFTLRVYQTQAQEQAFFTFVDRRYDYGSQRLIDTFTTAPLMNADEYGSTVADWVWGGVVTNALNIADDTTTGTLIGNNRLCYVRFDTAVRTRESVSFGWVGSKRMRIQSYTIDFAPSTRDTILGGSGYNINNPPPGFSP